ncbi:MULTISPECIES: hypothetical protein [Vibrio]|uniref:hypothetical protein n=1 Tax=Vibrio TaxID=662 RepID=UPI001C5C8E6F|nr:MULTISPECIES: hypothetical protein [Vibrio]MDA0120283.1 hypothetical protein [Vibrio sp. T11.5]QXX08801.1 hypothetical protein KW548_16840 [Vibrio neptunius]
MQGLNRMTLTVLASLCFTGCGGGGGGEAGSSGGGASTTTPTVTATSTPIENTADIVASRDFSFDVGQVITLSVDYSGSSDGAVHLYSQAAFTSDSGEVIADPTSRITTIYPSRTSTVTLEVNSNWQQIYAHWVPMASNETELSQVVTLDQASHSYQVSF